MADGVAAAALWALVEEAEIEALVGGQSDMQRFAVGGASVVLGPSGSVIITAAGDALGDSGVWSAEEVRLVGEAPAPVTKRLLGDLEAWGADESSLPIHLAVRVAEGLLYLGTGRRQRAVGRCTAPGSRLSTWNPRRPAPKSAAPRHGG
ncbi:hypothetical protein ABZ387_34985 [Streptomyces flaveolus]|uniref:hypothetical protein n=1 Tax=Streptomyces flaveolus TaxID=67297 RepID=UPI0033D4F1CC